MNMDTDKATLDMRPLISINHVCLILGKSRATIFRWVKAGKLIKPVSRNGRTIGWNPSLFEQWRSKAH